MNKLRPAVHNCVRPVFTVPELTVQELTVHNSVRPVFTVPELTVQELTVHNRTSAHTSQCKCWPASAVVPCCKVLKVYKV